MNALQLDINDKTESINFLKNYVNSKTLNDMLAKEMNKLSVDYNYEPNMGNDQYVIEKNNYFSLVLRNVEKKALTSFDSKTKDNRILCYANDVFVMNLGPGILSYTNFETPAGHDQNVFDKSKALVEVGQVEHSVGGVMHIRAGKDVLKLDEITDDCIFLELASMPKYSQVWVYNSESLEPIYSSSSKVMSSRINHCLKVLELQGFNLKSMQIVEELVNHRDHFVRWEALRLLMDWAPDKAWQVLIKMKSDPHPHIKYQVDKVFKNQSGGK